MAWRVHYHSEERREEMKHSFYIPGYILNQIPDALFVFPFNDSMRYIHENEDGTIRLFSFLIESYSQIPVFMEDRVHEQG
jgi:hypothetical protein